MNVNSLPNKLIKNTSYFCELAMTILLRSLKLGMVIILALTFFF